MTHHSKHDKIVVDLEQRLRDELHFMDIWPFAMYYHKGRFYETDLAAVKNNCLYLFEVKSNNSYRNLISATHQLLRDKRYYDRGKYSRVFLFYVYGSDNDRGYFCERLKLKPDTKAA